MVKQFNILVDFLIHPSLKLDKSVYEKSKIAVLAYFIISIGYYCNIKAFNNYLGLATSICVFIIIKTTGKTNFALSLGALLGFYLITASSYLSGGINSNDVLWYIVLATSTFMLIGNKVGFFISTISLLALTFFYIADVYNKIPISTDTVATSLPYRYFNFILVLFVQSFTIYILVTGNKKLQKLFNLNKEEKVKIEIANDFNHKIGNKLASLMHLTELIKINKTETEQEKLFSNIDFKAKDVYDNFRDFIWILDAKSDHLTELFMYLRDFADDYFKFSDVNIFISSSPDQLPEIILPSSYSKEIVPLIKEALTNISKHAEANNVNMIFQVSKSTLTIKLQDDGKGFDPNKEYGIGLKSMIARTQKLGGAIEINTSLSKGTEIIFNIMLHNKPDAFIKV